MKNLLVILFAAVVAVTSAARLPEANSKLSLADLEPVLQKIIDHISEKRPEVQIEDVFEKEAVVEISQPKEDDDSLEEFRQKQTNWKNLLAKMVVLEKQQQSAAELSDQEDSEDSDVFVSYGLEKPVKIDEVKNSKENDDDYDEEVIDMSKADIPDVQVSFGVAEQIEDLALKKSDVDDEDEDDEENESIIPFREIKKDEVDDDDVQVSFGLDEPIAASTYKKTIQQEDANDDDDDEEDDDKPSDLNEKVMAEVISSVLKKFAKAYDLKL